MSTDRVMIGDRLKKLIEENGMDISKGSLMESYGFNKSNIDKYLNNYRKPNLEDIIKLAVIFNTSVDYLVQNSDYILDTWDPAFIDEFIDYASEKMENHFKDRQRITLPNSDKIYSILFGLTHFLISGEKTFEDFSQNEKERQKQIIDYIINIYYGLIRMSKQDNFNINEFKGILGGISDFIDGEYSFKHTSIIDFLEKKEDITESEKIEIIKSYIHLNMANSQKALNLLEDLTELKK